MIRAARYLGVAPWELAKQSVYWRNLALAFEAAENGARNVKHEKVGMLGTKPGQE